VNLSYGDPLFGWDAMFAPEPSWMREAARQLHTIADVGRDWSALARRLGYTNREMRRMQDDESQLPALSLLRDWFESNGRSTYCVDVLSSCLRLINREDVLRLLHTEQAADSMASLVFLSYQSASQGAALQLRRRLELSGFSCWMDVQLTGGEQLFARIYDGLARCRLVICCMTNRYCASRTCVRELTLADALHKPIMPLMLEPLPWPPPGPLALILSPLLYVDLCGVGGHGGSGRRADRETRMREIVDRVAQYVSGCTQSTQLEQPLPLPDLFAQVQPQGHASLAHEPDQALSALYAARLGSGQSANSDRSLVSRTTADPYDELSPGLSTGGHDHQRRSNAVDAISHRSAVEHAQLTADDEDDNLILLSDQLTHNHLQHERPSTSSAQPHIIMSADHGSAPTAAAARTSNSTAEVIVYAQRFATVH
jgi:hypothetical protein